MPLNDDDLSEREFPDESDMDDRDDEDTDPCPHCGLPVYQHAQQCPYCKMYISEEEAPTAARTPSLFTVAVVVCIAIVVIAWIFGK